jgi:hypothetical protein
MSTTTGRLVRHAWSVVSWIVLTGLVTGVAAALYYYQRADDELRKLVESQLAEIYPNLLFRVGSAQILKGEGIRLGQISIVRDQEFAEGGRSEIIYAERLTLRCDATLPALLQRKLAVRQIVCEGVNLHIWRDARGAWNLADLVPPKPPRCALDRIPEITIENATWQLRDVGDPQGRTLHGENVSLRVRIKPLAPAEGSDGDEPSGVPRLLVACEGSFRTPLCQRVDWEGVARTTDGAWTLRGHVTGAAWSPDAARQLPSFLAGRLPPLAPLRARADVQFRCGRPSRNLPFDYELSGRVSDAHWQDDHWPQPISNISCEFLVNPQGCQINHLIGAYGTARVGGDLRADGLDPTQPFAIDLTLDRFPLTENVVTALPASLQENWRKFRAEGMLSGAIHVQFDGRRYGYRSELTVQELTLRHYQFPYPITECHGDFNLSDELCEFDLIGSAGGTPVNLRGMIHQPGAQFTGWWDAKTTRWKAIDDALVDALPLQVKTFVRRLQLRGNAGFWVRYNRTDPAVRPAPEMIVDFDQAWISYDGFPYPVNNIQGRLEARQGRFTFTDLRGWNDDCQVLCHGSWDSQDPSQPLDLRFELHNVGLDDELKHALRPAAQRIWSQLRPDGRIDRVDLHLFKTRELAKPELNIQVAHRHPPQPERPDTQSVEPPDGLQLQPTWLPLRLSHVQGEARLRGTSLVVHGFTAEHGKLRMQTNVSGEMLPDGRWSMNLTSLTVDRLEVTDSLLQALPAPLVRPLTELGLGGTFSLAGAVRLDHEHREAPVSASWDLALNVEQGRFRGGLPTTGIFGQIHVNGASRGDQFWARGRLQLDSLVSHAVQLTGVDGPFWLDSTRIVFGQRVPPQSADEVNRPITATVYQGKASVNAELMLNPQRDFSVQINVTSADLSPLSRDWQLGRGNLSGQAFLELFLTGNQLGRHTLRGNGTAQLRNANLYELPLILAVLSRLGSGRTNNTAFSNSDIAFHLSDGYVYFDRFDLAGDAITLKGIGEMSLERQLSLDFYSIMGREQFWNPLVRPFLGEASRQFLLIHVDGTLSNPRTTQEVLPGLNETLQQLFPELTNLSAGPPQADGRSERSRLGLFPSWR